MTHLQKSLLKVKTAAFSAIMLLACAGGTACANDRVSEAENLVKALITELEKTSSQADVTDKDNRQVLDKLVDVYFDVCLLYTSPSPRDKRQSRMPSSA